VKCPLGPKKGGITRDACLSERRSLMRKPLSAITISPSSSKERIPDFLVIYFSDIEPVYKSLTKVTSPEGAMPIRPLNVVLDL
jgi:hypothetical protein